MSARKCPPHFFTKFKITMKYILSFLAIIALLASYTRPIPPQATPKPKTDYAETVSFHPGHLLATFENGAFASIYFGGGASVVIPGQSQIEISGKAFPEADGSYICSNSENGDYLRVYPSGFATAKVAGICINFSPRKNVQ